MSDLPLSPAAASAWFGTPLLRRGLLALAGGLLSLLGGCAVYSSGQPVHDDYRQPLVYSQTEPVREVVTVRPNVGVVWVPGVFAAGDCTTVPYKQIIIAMGEGAKASLSAFDHLIRSGAPAH